jgi:hypothetical protein
LKTKIAIGIVAIILIGIGIFAVSNTMFNDEGLEPTVEIESPPSDDGEEIVLTLNDSIQAASKP